MAIGVFAVLAVMGTSVAGASLGGATVDELAVRVDRPLRSFALVADHGGVDACIARSRPVVADLR